MRDLSGLKICFLAGTLEHGGAERQLFYLLRALVARGVAARVLALDQGEFWEAPIRSLGVPVTWVGGRGSRIARLIRIIRELRADPPDLLQSQHFFANAYVGLAARALGITGIGAVRDQGTPELQQDGLCGAWLNLRLPHLIAANSRVAIQNAMARGLPAARLYFLPNVVDTRAFGPVIRLARRPVTLLAVGRIVNAKRFDRFITALGRLRSALGLDVRGWIAGPAQDGGLRREWEALASTWGLLPTHLRFLGRVSRMRPLYTRADLCVLTSDFEGTPNVLLEAMASGLPVVATRVGGVPDMVVDGLTGLTVERDDADGLLAALVELVKDDQRRLEMGRRAREQVEANYSLERLPGYLEKLYDLASPSPQPGRLGIVEERPV